MALDKYHLTNKGNEWRPEKAGSNRARVKAPIKADAMKQMQDSMKTHEGSVRIHIKDGKIQEERGYPTMRQTFTTSCENPVQIDRKERSAATR